MKKQTTTKVVASAVTTIDYFVKRGWDVSYDIGDIRASIEDSPEYIYILTIYRKNKEMYLQNYENLEDLLVGASAWLVQFAQGNGIKEEETE